MVPAAAGGQGTCAYGAPGSKSMQVSTGQMHVLHEPGEPQLADLGTKPLPRQRLQEDSDRKVKTLTTETEVKDPLPVESSI